MNLFEQIGEDIKAAMKARDKVRLDTLRNIKKVFLEAKTAPGANDTLTDADALKIISKRSSWHNRAATRQPTEIKQPPDNRCGRVQIRTRPPTFLPHRPTKSPQTERSPQ